MSFFDPINLYTTSAYSYSEGEARLREMGKFWRRERAIDGNIGYTWHNRIDPLTFITCSKEGETYPYVAIGFQSYDSDSYHKIIAYEEDITSFKEAIKIVKDYMESHHFNAYFSDEEILQYIQDKIEDGEELTEVEKEILKTWRKLKRSEEK